ncbi:MAG: type VI secretion system-associated protein TagF [Rhodospirillales bacterium]|nr:type VI secretion system-associated protein TagF [Rhodospirillales bacterium]
MAVPMSGHAEPAIVAGFYGKLPARGDFVGQKLPGAFVRPWDDWLARALGASQSALGAGWRDAWLEAPVWRFALAPGLCGAGTVLGLMLPSVDRAGRYFPLTFAALFAAGAAPAEPGGDADWLDRCEAAGRAALENDADPDGVAARMGDPPARAPALGTGSAWWTEGGPRVPPGHASFPSLPDPELFHAMIQAADGTAAAP